MIINKFSLQKPLSAKCKPLTMAMGGKVELRRRRAGSAPPFHDFPFARTNQKGKKTETG